jgi:hypothetical protein
LRRGARSAGATCFSNSSKAGFVNCATPDEGVPAYCASDCAAAAVAAAASSTFEFETCTSRKVEPITMRICFCEFIRKPSPPPATSTPFTLCWKRSR